MIPNNNIARSILLIKDGISYKRRRDLEDKYISTVWVQININSKTSFLLCAYYRQWSLPSNLNINNSNSVNSQKERYIKYSDQIRRASKEGKDLVILADENIDSYDENSSSNRYRNIEIKNIRNSNIIEHSLTYHNDKPTIIRGNRKNLY